MGAPGKQAMGGTGRWTAAVLAALLVVLLAGCSVQPLTPWVKPYEREHFADPIMSANRDRSRACILTTCTRAAKGPAGLPAPSVAAADATEDRGGG
jgi:hypothetical protein